MELKFGYIHETALIPLAIKANGTARPDAWCRIFSMPVGMAAELTKRKAVHHAQ